MKFKYIINAVPPSNNEFIGRNARWEYQQIKREWADRIFWFCRPRPEKIFQSAIVEIKYYFPTKIRHDPDNYSGKMILDGLVAANILADDSFSCTELKLSASYDKQNPRTEITITEREENV